MNPQGNPSKLYMVTRSSDDVSRAIPGQPKRISRNYSSVPDGFMCFDFEKVFSALSVVQFFSFAKAFVRLRLFGLEQTTTATRMSPNEWGTKTNVREDSL